MNWVTLLREDRSPSPGGECPITVCLGAEDLGRYWLLVRANVIQPTWVLLTASLTARVGNAAARQQPDAVPGGIY